MSVLSLSELDATSELWHVSHDELSYAWVNLQADQMAAFIRPGTSLVMCAWALPDPRWWTWADPAVAPPMEVRGRGGGPVRRPTIPAVLEVDWDSVAELSAHERYGSLWQRFPSVPGRIILPDGAYEPEPSMRYVRCWDQAAITVDQADEIVEAMASVWLTGDFAMLRDWWAVYDNQMTACDLCDIWDRDRELHTHRAGDGFMISEGLVGREEHAHWGQVFGCLDGDATYSDMQREYFVGGDVTTGYKELLLPDPILSEPVLDRWQTLAETSQAQAELALSTVSALDRDAARAAEQYGGRPWG